MSRVLVIGDYLDDRYRFYEQTRTDPANNNAPVVVNTTNVSVDGGAGNLVKNIESLFFTRHFRIFNLCIIHFI